MFYKEFVTAVIDEVSTLFPQDSTIHMEKLQKNNGVTQDALLIRLPGRSICPTIYLVPFYDDYIQGQSIKSIAQSIHDYYFEYLPDKAPNLDDLLDFDKSRQRLTFSLINYNTNVDRLKDIACVRKLDFAMIFLIDVEIEGIQGTFTLTNEYLRLWNKSPYDLEEIAIENTPKLRPARFFSIASVLRRKFIELPPEISFDPDNDLAPFYVLSNDAMTRGAACIYYPDVLSDFAKKIDDDIYIIPSSIHEVLILPSSFVDDSYALKQIIEIVNKNELDPTDILSNNLYYYSRSNDILTVAI